MRKSTVSLIIFILTIGITSNANAVLLFHEDFNTGRNVAGVPTIAKGADNDWYGARFEPGGGTIRSDIGMRKKGNNRFAQFKDDAGILINVSTLNYTDVILDFNWRTKGTERNDRFRAGWFDGIITGFDSYRVKDLTSGPASWSNWTELLAGTPTSDWQYTSYSLPSNQSNLWLAFWMDDGNRDRGWVDNINVNGTVIPEPATLTLLGLGLLGLYRLKRKKI